jgi:N6-adenosine-specific RNA methylase IME4
MRFHPAAEIFPLLQGAAFAELAADIRANGLLEPIVTYDGAILDGRNRWRACNDAEVAPRFEAYAGNDPLGFVISTNLKRRHLNSEQRAMAGARVATLPDGVRKDRQGGPIGTPTIDEAAALMSVSARSIKRARVVLDEAVPALIAAVDNGQLAVSTAAQAAKLDAKVQRDLAAKAKAGDGRALLKVLKQRKRDANEKALALAQFELPDRKFGVILADPEWKFETWSADGLLLSADNHYPVSGLEAIKARDVPSIAADDCVLFLWATVPMLPHALDVMAAWGFAYKSHCVWVKDKDGTGYWFRNRHELLLVGVKGDIPAPAAGTQWSSVLTVPRGRHSAKPEESLRLIEAYFPHLSKIELNRRGPAREGWAAWGSEVEAAE